MPSMHVSIPNTIALLSWLQSNLLGPLGPLYRLWPSSFFTRPIAYLHCSWLLASYLAYCLSCLSTSSLMTCLLYDMLPFARQCSLRTSCLVSPWFTIRLLPHLALFLSSLSSISWSLRPLPHLSHAPLLFSLFYFYLWSLTLNQSWLLHMQRSSQPICLILTLQNHTILIAQTYFPNITHNTLQQSYPLIRQTTTHCNLLITSSLTQNVIPLQGPVAAAL